MVTKINSVPKTSDANAPAERIHPEDRLAESDQPLADRRMDDEGRRVHQADVRSAGDDLVVGVAPPFPLVAELEQGVAVLGVVGLVEDQLVGVAEVDHPRHERDAGDHQGDHPADDLVRRHRDAKPLPRGREWGRILDRRRGGRVGVRQIPRPALLGEPRVHLENRASHPAILGVIKARLWRLSVSHVCMGNWPELHRKFPVDRASLVCDIGGGGSICDACTVTDRRETGLLVLAATPIGNAGDASPRLRAALAEADLIAAEDTRRLRRLLGRLEVTTGARIVSYFEGNEAARDRRAGTRPRRRRHGAARHRCRDAVGVRPRLPAGRRGNRARHPVTAIPGPSAALTALALSGLPVDRFCFEGFLPRKSSQRMRRLAELAGEPRTMIFFEAPHRMADTLAALAETFGAERRAAACRELTKTYEEIRRGTLTDLLAWANSTEIRGELTLVVAGASPPGPANMPTRSRRCWPSLGPAPGSNRPSPRSRRGPGRPRTCSTTR